MTTPSVRTMLLQLAGMADTVDLNDWENGFLKRQLKVTNNATRTSCLTDTQIERIEELWRKHFAGWRWHSEENTA